MTTTVPRPRSSQFVRTTVSGARPVPIGDEHTRTTETAVRRPAILDLDAELRERLAATLAAKKRRTEQQAAIRAAFQPGREMFKRLHHASKIKRNRIVRRKR